MCLTFNSHKHIATIRENCHHLPTIIRFTYFVDCEKTQYIGQIIKSAPNTKDHGTYYHGNYAPVGSALVIIDTWTNSKEVSRVLVPCDRKFRGLKQYTVSPDIIKAKDTMEMYYNLLCKLFDLSGQKIDNMDRDNFEMFINEAWNVPEKNSMLLCGLHGLHVRLLSEISRDRTPTTSSNEVTKEQQILNLTQQLLAILNQ